MVVENSFRAECLSKIHLKSNSCQNSLKNECLSEKNSKSNVYRKYTEKWMFVEYSLKLEYLLKIHSKLNISWMLKIKFMSNFTQNLYRALTDYQIFVNNPLENIVCQKFCRKNRMFIENNLYKTHKKSKVYQKNTLHRMFIENTQKYTQNRINVELNSILNICRK